MHILLFHFYSGKPNPVYQEIASALRRRGHTVWVGAPDQRGDLAWRDGERLVRLQPGPAHLHARVERVPLLAPVLRHISTLSFMLRVRSFLRETGPDIVQVDIQRSAWVLPLRMPSRVRLIYDVRQINEMVSNSLDVRAREKWLIANMRACSRFFYHHACFCHVEAAKRILGDNWSRWSSVVPVGLDPLFLEFNLSPSTTPCSDHRVRFVYVGTLSRIRNLERLLFAVQQLFSQTENFQVDLVGPDAAVGFYHDMVDRLGVGSVVSLKSPVPYKSIPKLLASYDVGLAYVPDRPTWHYQPTIKVKEYRALGLPILSTDVRSHREVVEDGINGLLAGDSVQDMARAMGRFVGDPEFLQRCKENAQAMRCGVTWDEVARMYEQNVYTVGEP